MAKRMGGADKVKRQHDGGRLTVRERIDRLVDRAASARSAASPARPSMTAATTWST
jgi:acetyl-CoA carboxylase carboxyltransferase component